MIPGESVSEEVGMELAAVIADRIFRGRGERLVEMMKVSAARKAGHPLSIMSWTVRSCFVVGSSGGRVERSNAGGARMMGSPAARGFWTMIEV